MDEENKVVTEETTEVAEVKKTRKPREKTRSVEECYELPVSKLTDKEKELLIKDLKENYMLMTNKAEAYKQNAEAAFNQTRQAEDQYKAMEKFYRDLLRYVDMQLNAFHTAINQGIKGGVE